MLWDGRPIGLAERLRFGYMPEERGLYPRMPVGEQIEYFGRLHGLDASAARAAAARWLGSARLAGRAAAKVEELSHGNQQRAQLAAALVFTPELLVLDEPFAGLDPVAVRTLAEILRAEAARGAAVLFSSHQLELVEDICEDVAIIDQGRIVASDDLATLKRRRAGADRAPARGRPAAVAAGGRRRRNRRAPQRRPAARWPDVDPEQVLAAAERTAQVVEFKSTARPLLPSSSLELVASDRAARITLVARREIRERLRSRRSSPRRWSCSSSSVERPRSKARSRRPRPTGRRYDTGAAGSPSRCSARRNRSTTQRSDYVGRLGRSGTPALDAEEVDALLLLSQDRLLFLENIDAKAAAIADTAVRALRNELPPAPELTASTLHPPADETTDAETLVAYVGSCSCSCR